MYHREFYKQGIVTNLACMAKVDCNDDDDDEEEEQVSGNDESMMVSTVWEMKNKVHVLKQLFANMLHFGYQLTVKTL